MVDESLAVATADVVELEPIQIGPLRGFPDVKSTYRGRLLVIECLVVCSGAEEAADVR